jgi:DHA1 family L-arabinose/isopropyl-beta-D-thiogalactopyranoside export protein-like MFS transporter
MSEFMPIGILTGIADDFGISESSAGLIISFYAWAVAILSLPMMLLFRNMEYRRLMLLMVAVFAAFQILAGFSTDYWMLLVARLGVAFAHSVFWSIVTPMAVRSVDQGYRNLAIGGISVGTAVAMILGLPLGRVIGLSLGWRAAFLSVALISVGVLILLAVVLPRMENPGTFTLRRLPDILGNRILIGIYIVLALFVTGVYTVYSYIEPFLLDAGQSEMMITVGLSVMGVAGIIAGIIFAKGYDRRRKAFMALSILGPAACFLLLDPFSGDIMATMLLIVIWGMCVTLFNMSFQNELMKIAVDDGVTIANSLFSGIYNVGIAAGSMVGGFVTDSLGVSHIGFVGGTLVMSAFVLMLVYVMPSIARTWTTRV